MDLGSIRDVHAVCGLGMIPRLRTLRLADDDTAEIAAGRIDLYQLKGQARAREHLHPPTRLDDADASIRGDGNIAGVREGPGRLAVCPHRQAPTRDDFASSRSVCTRDMTHVRDERAAAIIMRVHHIRSCI